MNPRKNYPPKRRRPQSVRKAKPRGVSSAGAKLFGRRKKKDR